VTSALPVPHERRTSPRLRLLVPVDILRTGSAYETARTANVSASGLLFLTRSDGLVPGTGVGVRIRGVGPFVAVLPRHVVAFGGTARVVRVAEGPDGLRAVAVRFERPLEPEGWAGPIAARAR
jgi:hypothetical protein